MASAVSEDQQQAKENRIFYRELRPGETASVTTAADGTTVVTVSGTESEDEE